MIGTATSGLTAAVNRFDTSASKAALAEAQAEPDLAKEAAEMLAAKIEVAANVAVVRTGSKTVGALVDILA